MWRASTWVGKAGDYAHVVFRTTDPIARGNQNSLEAGVAVEGVQYSVGSVNKAHNVYGAYVVIKGGSIAARGAGDSVVRKGAKLGRAFKIVVLGRDGTKYSRTVTLRTERKGDDAGRPLTR